MSPLGLGNGMEEFVRWGEDIELEENLEVINVAPYVTVDGEGFLVADEREAQIRSYDRLGRLRANFGSKGSGPAEFRFPTSALRISTGEILVFDAHNKAVLFDSIGAAVLRTYRTPFGPVYKSRILNDSTALVAGRLKGNLGGPFIHIWNFRTDTVVRSFFSIVPPDQNYRVATTAAGFAAVSARGDTIAAVFALSDTVYLFGLDGGERGKIPIPFTGYRAVTKSAPHRNSSKQEREGWYGSFSLITDVFWEPDGSFLVQYQDRIRAEQRWNLLKMDRQGKAIFEFADTPELVAVDGTKQTLYFVKPGSATPNIWSVATWIR